MSVMDGKLLERLNDYLGNELGRRADGHSIFKWKNSDQLFWPAFATGRKVLQRVEVPLLKPVEAICPECEGSGISQDNWEEPDDAPVLLCDTCSGKGKVTKTSDVVETAVPEYRADRQMRARNVWVVTKWLDPEALIWGWVGRHGGETRPSYHPPHERLVEMWNERFPGAEFPRNGWRIPTDAVLPRSPNDPREPNWNDTRHFVAQVKEQTRINFAERLDDMLASQDAIEASKTRRIEDAIRDCFPAMLNPTPGKKGSFVSFPWTKRDRV